jgi:hypothetical protein
MSLRKKFAGGGAPIQAKGEPGMQWGAGIPEDPTAIIKPSDRKKPEAKASRTLRGWDKGKTRIAGLFASNALPGATPEADKKVKYGPQRTEVYDLLKPEQLKKLQALEKAAHFDEEVSPSKFIFSRKELVVGDRLIVYLTWADVFYRRILP